mgnify:CR=1 FL=1
MDKPNSNPLDETLEQEIEAQAPEQEATHKWEFKPRQNPKWGTVEKAGLIVGRGANKKVIPPDEVYKLAALGVTQKEIAIWFGIPEETVRYNFADYIAKGKEDTKQRLRQAMLKNAITNNNAALQIFLAKNMLGMSDSPNATDTDKILPWSDNK